jgi:RES domain-containing protein
LGDHWLDDKRTLLLQVPSTIVPASVNWLFNAAHADASSARIAKPIRAAFDSRPFKTARDEVFNALCNGLRR